MTTATGKPLSISRILIGDPYVLMQDGVLIPVRRVRVLAENGAMFSRIFLAFGLDKDRVRQAWDAEPQKFLKVDLNKSDDSSEKPNSHPQIQPTP